MYAKFTDYDKAHLAEQARQRGPIEVFTFGTRRDDVRTDRYIRMDGERERVCAHNTATGEVWGVPAPIVPEEGRRDQFPK